MNEAWGAVVAAVAAGVFGVGGALLGIYVGRKQTTDQAHVEHEQWLRGQRREAYIAYLASWDEVHTKLFDIMRDLPILLDPATYENDEFEEFFTTTVDPPFGGMLRAMETVELLGPERVVSAARKASDGILELRMFLGHGACPRPANACAEEQMEFRARSVQKWQLRMDFFAEARKVMATAPKPSA
ncbi:hypothetical protein HEP85_38565 [Streptomyces sp. RPA4-2]|uniref:hypothetical protein n=1 Tax=Streptomyces sp. RPA4-2 TaxID=2721244 RepID=UPI00143E6073|nr:hypothetical protein [Streptomyces sp. RPA4-2]QIY60391.1 hypothetical protein HEP85_38565 [Streptomyces sp. RPA4-2]